MSYIVGATSYLMIGDEATWGTMPAVPVYYALPVNNYNVRFKPESRQATPYLGIFQRKHNKIFRGMPSGQLECALYGWQPATLGKSFMEYLLTWGFGSHEVVELPSKFAEWAEGPNVANKRHLGLRVNSATLSGADGQPLSLQLELQGQSESGNDVVTAAQTIPVDHEKLVDAEFSQDTTFKLAGAAINLSAFSVQIQNGLKVEYLNSFTPALIVKTQRVITVQFTPMKTSDVYDAYNRTQGMTEFTGEIKIKALHNGTGTTDTDWTVATISFPRLSFQSADTQGGMQDVLKQPLSMFALKPDTSSTDMSIVFTEE